MSFLEEGCDVWLKNMENMVTGSEKNNIWKSIPVLGADVKALFDLNWIMEFSEPCLLTQILELLQDVKGWGKTAATGLPWVPGQLRFQLP